MDILSTLPFDLGKIEKTLMKLKYYLLNMSVFYAWKTNYNHNQSGTDTR